MLLSMLLLQKMHLKNLSFLSWRKKKTAREESKSFFLISWQIFWGMTQYFHVTEHEFGFGYWQLLPLPQQREDGERSSEHEIPGNSF